MLATLGPAIDLPLYHQPSDTAVYLRNRTQFLAFRPRLLQFLRRRQKEKEARHRYLMLTYNKWMGEWGKRVSDLEKANNGPSVATGAAAVTATAAVAVTTTANASTTAQPPSTGVVIKENPNVFLSCCIFLFFLVLNDLHSAYSFFSYYDRIRPTPSSSERRNVNSTRKCFPNCASKEKTAKGSLEWAPVSSSRMLTSKKSWTAFRNRR